MISWQTANEFADITNEEFIAYRTGYKISTQPSSLKSQNNNIQVQKPDQNSNHNRLEKTESLVVRGSDYQKLKILVSIPALLVVLITRFLLWLIRISGGARILVGGQKPRV